jgi:hypothetical protein
MLGFCFVYIKMAVVWIMLRNPEEEEGKENPLFSRVGERERYDVEE